MDLSAHLSKEPVWREVHAKVGQHAEDSHTEVSHCQVSQEKVGCRAHLPVPKYHDDYEKVT